MQEATVVLGVKEPALQEEILHFLERLPGVRVVGAATGAAELARRIRDEGSAVAVASPEVLREPAELDGAALLVVATEERTADLRVALGAGARGFYVWPGEREELGRAAVRLAPPPPRSERLDGRVVAVCGARGGAGATFLATNLAAACALEGASALLVDLDLTFADIAAALGMRAGEGSSSLEDLAPVLDELAEQHIDPVLQEHTLGFKVLCGPERAGSVRPLSGPQGSRLIRVVRSSFDVTVAHLPRALDDGVRGALEAVDEVLLVLTVDVLGFRAARRALDELEAIGVADRCRLVVNRAARSEIVPADVEPVFGAPPAAVIRADRAVPRAQNRAELVVRRSGPAARAVRKLARELVQRKVPA